MYSNQSSQSQMQQVGPSPSAVESEYDGEHESMARHWTGDGTGLTVPRLAYGNLLVPPGGTGGSTAPHTGLSSQAERNLKREKRRRDMVERVARLHEDTVARRDRSVHHPTLRLIHPPCDRCHRELRSAQE